MTIDHNPVPVTYSDEELDYRVRGIIQELAHGEETTFYSICHQITELAKNEGKLRPNTQYSSSELSSFDQVRISRIIWDLIQEGKVFTFWGNKMWFGVRSDDTLFIINKH